MTDSEMEVARPGGGGSGRRSAGSARTDRQLGLCAFVALAGCGVLATVWRAAADENRGQAMAAVKALEQVQDSAQRIEAIRDLVRSVVIDGQIVIPPLIHLLSDLEIDVRVEAARSLGPATSAAALAGSGDDRVKAAIAALMGLLDDDEPAVRIAAVYSLGAIAASTNPSGKIQPQNLVTALTAMLDDPDAIVRASTIVSLGVAGPVAAPDPPPALIAALDDESSFNRAAVVRTLARFPRGVDRLIPILLDVLEKEQDESPVREPCLEVLRQIDAERTGPGKRDPGF